MSIRKGATLTGLAKKYGVSVRTLTNWKRELEVKTYRKPTGSWKKRIDVSIKPENHAALKAMCDESHSLGDLADMAIEKFVRERA